MNRRKTVGCAWLLCSLLAAREVRAASCEAPGDAPLVVIRFEGGFESALERAALDQLTSGLERQGLLACSQGTASAPLATLTLARSGPGEATVSMMVDDRLTLKQVRRVVQLQAVASEEQALALAVSAEELVRATWAEVALEARAPSPAVPVPPPSAVTNFVGRARPAVRTPADRGWALQLGVDYFLRWQVPWWFGTVGWQQAWGPGHFRVALEVAGSLPQRVAGGEVRFSGFGVEAGFELDLLRRPSWLLRTGPVLAGTWIQAFVEPSPGYRANASQLVVLRPRWNLSLHRRLGAALWVGAEARVSAVAHGLELRSGNEPVTGITGASAGGSIALGASW